MGTAPSWKGDNVQRRDAGVARIAKRMMASTDDAAQAEMQLLVQDAHRLAEYWRRSGSASKETVERAWLDKYREEDPFWNQVLYCKIGRDAPAHSLEQEVWYFVAEELASSLSGNTTKNVLNRIVIDIVRQVEGVTGHHDIVQLDRARMHKALLDAERREEYVIRQRYGHTVQCWVRAVLAETRCRFDLLFGPSVTVYRGLSFNREQATRLGLVETKRLAFLRRPTEPRTLTLTSKQFPLYVISSFSTSATVAARAAKQGAAAPIRIVLRAEITKEDVFGTAWTGAVAESLGNIEEEVLVLHRDRSFSAVVVDEGLLSDNDSLESLLTSVVTGTRS